MALQARRLEAVESVFGIDAADRLLRESLPFWMQGLGLLAEAVEAGRPAGAAPDWQPGAVIRLPFSTKLCRNGVVCAQALMAAADTAMMMACAAAWNGYRPMSPRHVALHVLHVSHENPDIALDRLNIGLENADVPLQLLHVPAQVRHIVLQVQKLPIVRGMQFLGAPVEVGAVGADQVGDVFKGHARI